MFKGSQICLICVCSISEKQLYEVNQFQTVKNEGLMALYKGFIPTWVRMGPWNIIFFVTYEQLKQLY
jgi:hypothetical protein